MMLIALAGGALALDNGFSAPPMGWSALYGAPFGAVNETVVLEAARGLKASGLLAAGYSYVTLDDWFAERDATGAMVAKSDTFPSGMAAVSAGVHAAGCLFGVYSAAGMRTCANFSASLFNEKQDAATFAHDWQIDYLKYDACRYNAGVAGRARYEAMGRALNATGRKIFYSVEGWSADPLQDNDWAPEVANMWRTGADIWPYWDSGLPGHAILYNLYTTNYAAPYHGVGSTNDPDMLQPPGDGKLLSVRAPGLTSEEARSQVVLWAIMKAPLTLGVHWSQLADLPELDPAYFALLTHAEMLAIDQDPSPQATLRAQMPSQAQQTGANAMAGLPVTLQKCDKTRADQRFEPTKSGNIQLAGSSLCLDVQGADDSDVRAVPCSAGTLDSWTLQRDSMLSTMKNSKSAQCLSAAGGALPLEPDLRPTAAKCLYAGAMPPPLDVANNHDFGKQLFIWSDFHSQIVSGGTGQCLTAGLPNYVPGMQWTNNSGTLEHEVWMGDLTSSGGRARRVVVLFNKGRATETVTAAAELIGTAGATGATAVRDVLAKEDLAPLAPGGNLAAAVPSHGVALFVLAR
jgi:hypothetical protein